MLKLKNITKDYQTSSETVHALRGISLSFRQNEFVSILGPSGCGKTTMLNIIGGLDHYTTGDLVIAGKSTKAYTDRDWDVYRNHRIGFIFQSYNLIPHQTVLGNVELALTIAGISKEERVARAKRALDRVGLKGQYNKRPNQLSGGQCQRVAIARALVNDPEILLADEPTGALDTVTSKQIMDLIKEISGERLVIMVTHNPELAEEYSTRIIRLLDGEVVEDTNPYAPEEEIQPITEIKAEESAQEAKEEIAVKAETDKANKSAPKKAKKAKKERAKMSFFTSFMLSAKNLLSKKGRTAMVGFAGSIGIIGIAMVLAFSGGISGYIEAMQDDMLSGNPISITETAYDLEALTGMMGSDTGVSVGTPNDQKKPGNVYISSLVEYLATMETIEDAVEMENNITKEYVDYLLAMDKDRYSAMTLRYGIDLSQCIYTEFLYSNKAGFDAKTVSVKSIVDTCTSLLKETPFSDYASAVPMLVPQFAQAPNSEEYILSQYDLVGDGSRVATGKNEIMLVISKDDEISDLLLAMLGYYTQEEFEEIVNKATNDKEYDDGNYKAAFTYEELLDKKMWWYPNNTIFTKKTVPILGESYVYNHQVTDEFTGGEELKVVGILKPKDDINFGCLTSGVYYTEALTNHILETNIGDNENEPNSEILRDAINGTLPEPVISGLSKYMILYQYNYTSWWYERDVSNLPEGATLPNGYENINGSTGTSFVGISMTMEDIIGSMMGGSGMGGSGMGSSGMGSSGMGGSSSGSSSGAEDTTTDDDMKERFIRALGGNSVPNVILIYPKSFDEMYKVTDYLEIWNTGDVGNEDCLILNDDGTPKLDEKGNKIYGVMINGTPYLADRPTIKATNTIELIVDLMQRLVNIITWALVGFTSVSLVVSTVMIGIITYVSVVERIKEIGVIRSLGGRKIDVANLFNAEAFIIGFLAGIFGITVTYLISLIINLIMAGIIGYSTIAALPLWQAVVLILLSVGLTCLSGIIPASSAARKDPVIALRTE